VAIEQQFLEYSAGKLEELAKRIEICLSSLDDERVWARGGSNENAIGNLVLHLCGNLRQWIVSGVGGAEDSRQRDTEFAARGGATSVELAEKLRATVAETVQTIREVPIERLSDRLVIQGYRVSKFEAIYHVVEHFSMHTGQIIFATKLLTTADLGFYRHLEAAP